MTDPLAGATRVNERHDVTPEQFAAEIATAYLPVVMRGLVAHWPAVAAGRGSPRALADYVVGFDRGRDADILIGPPEIAGRFFYRDDLSGFNFKRARIALPLLMEQLAGQGDAPGGPALYAGAAPIAENYPGWTEANVLPLELPDATPRLWIGNASRVSTHYDVASNVAAVVAGRRRFALFPPEQGENLYVGPLDRTPAGQPTSMVDLEAPDLDRFPRFAAARDAMLVAELEPGDALFIPSLWWHDVRATGSLNLLVNYWWSGASAPPFPALIHALLAVRDLPPREREAVRGWFDQYVFGERAGHAADHLPEHIRGVLGRPSPARDAAIRDYLRGALSRQ